MSSGKRYTLLPIPLKSVRRSDDTKSLLRGRLLLGHDSHVRASSREEDHKENLAYGS